MGEKDVTQKILASYNDVFADIVNGLLFEGEDIVSEDDLEDYTPYGYYKAEGHVRGQERDVAKRWKKGSVCFSCIGIENQSDPDPDMPLRVMAYDAAVYRNQLGKKMPDRRYPVVSIVLYLNHSKPWSGPIHLKKCLDIPPDLTDYVSDYAINVFPIAWMTREEVNRRFHGDFRIVADYFVQKRESGDYVPDPQVLQHAQEVMHLLSVMERDDRFEDAYHDMILADHVEKGEGWNMCDVLDKVENRGIEKGVLMERERMSSVLDKVESRGIEKGVLMERERMSGVLDKVESRGIEKGVLMERERMSGELDKVENRGIQKGVLMERERMSGELDKVESRGIEKGMLLERQNIIRSLVAAGVAPEIIASGLQVDAGYVQSILQN